MLQNIRSNIQGTTTKIVVWLIAISFAFFGIESILLGGGSSGVAEVNGEDISAMEVQQMVNTQKRQLISMLGEDIDPAMLDDQRLGAQAIQSIINRRLLMQSADDMNLTISELEVGRVVGAMEQFYLNGRFSPEVYKSTLAQAGFTPSSFKQGLKQDLLVNQLRSGLAGSEFATPAELALTAEIAAEQRDVRYLTIPLASVKTDIEVTEEQIQAYYESNQAEFYSPESVVLNYIELQADDFRAPVDEEELLSMFEQEKNSYQYQTENRVSHILLTQSDDESDQDYAERIATLQSALDSGQDFAELAEQYSDDIASASSGGDLGFSSGDAFPEEMESAIAALATNTVSSAVQTEAGTHFIVVTERREAESVTLEELRPELEQRLQDQVAAATLLSTVETLRDKVFNAQDLNGPAKDLELEVQTSEPLSRDQATGLFSKPAVLSAIYSEDVLDLGHNSEVIELSPQHFIVLRVQKHNQPELQALPVVRDSIIAAITDQTARERVTEKAQQALASIRSGQSVEETAKVSGYEWQVEIGAQRNGSMLPPALAQRVFRLAAPADGESVVDFTLNAQGDAEVFELSRVTAGSYSALAPQQQQGLQQQIALEYSNLLQQEFQQKLRNDADIVIY